ncbi:tripartite-type tricarboxylate transporter receptor subunit TctC [Primorskyibacter sedentarius]|uniref:Tripartite-type tricarboxylate transporter receptor subunit TctC n=1 Tax=Primorskyibacter sedentarius TaxID=745311 RepID=A0A4R3J2V0_9RHOB|nr:tripartite tricarboxylate transporter substrate binding protein [Primorskyibacter sedentarius]TCS59001.1 tripartite-type tricarboxylate transporter receptor subunit TctC [Primorskyibacter sedentarius]
MTFFKTLMAAAVGSLVTFTTAAVAQDDYPNKPITLVVSFPAGGNADIIARLNAEGLSRELGVPVNVINVPGGGMIPAVMNVLEKPADGYTLFRWTTPSVVIGPLVRKAPYDPMADMTPLFADETVANALYVSADSEIETFEQFFEVAKTKKMKMGVNNIGAPPHLSAVQLGQEFDLEFNNLVMKTVPASLLGLVGGQVEVAVGQVGSFKTMGDEIRPLVILDNDRKDFYERDLPGVPTVGEVFPGKNAATWIKGGIAVKAGTPQAVIDKLVAASEAAFTTDEFIAQVNNLTAYSWVIGVEDTTATIQEGIDLYKPFLDQLGLLAK